LLKTLFYIFSKTTDFDGFLEQWLKEHGKINNFHENTLVFIGIESNSIGFQSNSIGFQSNSIGIE